jgi:CheY-like chemotaxis protein
MTSRILALVDDLFFTAKISNTARNCGATLEIFSSFESLIHQIGLEPPALVIIDLNGTESRPFEAVQALKSNPVHVKIPIIAFYSHVQTDLMEQARQGGCDKILPRSLFSRNLAAILTEYARSNNMPSPSVGNGG